MKPFQALIRSYVRLEEYYEFKRNIYRRVVAAELLGSQRKKKDCY
jgi:hypothetical protein